MALNTISETSPKLAGVFSRLFSLEIQQVLASAYLEAIKHGGLTEPDFTREEGVSFNPRPARIALIQLNEAEILDHTLLEASLIHSFNPNRSKPTDSSEEIKKEDSLTQNQLNLIKLFHWFDRSRHSHLANPILKPDLLKLLLEESHQHLTTAEEHAPKLTQKIILWQQRNS